MNFTAVTVTQQRLCDWQYRLMLKSNSKVTGKQANPSSIFLHTTREVITKQVTPTKTCQINVYVQSSVIWTFQYPSVSKIDT